MRTFYVLSKALNGKRRLIGELTEENEEYTFKYRLNGKFHEWFLKLDEFPDVNKIYTGKEVYDFIYNIIPPKNDVYAKAITNSAGLPEYDIWGLLNFCGKISPHEDAYLMETIPEGTIIYD